MQRILVIVFRNVNSRKNAFPLRLEYLYRNPKEIYPCNENQLDALFILSLFRQSTSTCFEHMCSPSSGGTLYIYNTWYVLCFSVDCLLAGRPTDSQLKSSTRTNCCIYRVSQEECARLRESVPYVKLYRYNPKHLHPKLNGYGDNGQRSLKI